MSGARLYAESFAPWCEKARWALENRGVPYRYVEHVPMLGEASLRWAARKPFGLVTVPLFVDGDTVLMNSFAIARHAELRGQGAPLFPSGLEEDVAVWNDRSEIVMAAGRALLLGRMLENSEALAEQLPPWVPARARPAMRGMAKAGVRYIARKYQVRADEDHETRIREALNGLRAALGVRAHLLGDALSYADITMAAALQFILPVDDRFIALGPATRSAWTHPALAAEYADLVAWRDGLYALRGSSASRSG